MRKSDRVSSKVLGQNILNDPNNIHDYINSFKKIGEKSCSEQLCIKGLTGTPLTEHMAKYTKMRALLVTDQEIAAHTDYIPLPSGNFANYDDGNFIFNKIPVKDYYFRKKNKRPSLACGPDRISHKHIYDLWDALEQPLQLTFNKPLDGFHNIERNYTRYILKGPLPRDEKDRNEKITRPICEANILSKYGPIQAFVDSLVDELLPKLNKNQYSLKGRGTPLAVFDLLDEINAAASLNKPMLICIWDFSNAFCTFSHEALLKILKAFNLSDEKINLVWKLLQQTGTQVKMSDGNGYYLSKIYFTYRGEPQGQIGVDLMFIASNDGLNPITISIDQIASRIKFVDDWTDTFIANTVKELIKLFEFNVDKLLKGATSVGLKLNHKKTQIIPVHCINQLDQFQDYYDKE